ncbi:hypothetical protein ACFLWU_05215 [Chloroflexota bacterium]
MVANAKDISKASAELQDYISKLDVDAAGVASLDDLKGTKLAESTLKLLPTGRSIVVLATEVYSEVINLASPKRVTGTASLNDLIDRHMEFLGGRLTKAVYDIAVFSRRAGMKALPLPSAGCPVDGRFLDAVFSYKHAGQAAGLGYMGRSSLLIAPKFGPRVRLAVCLTEAILKPTTGEHTDECQNCSICIQNCPSGALSEPQNDEPYVMNKFACQSFRSAAGGCAECMKVCPEGH